MLVFKSAFARDVLEYMPAFQLSHEERGEEWRRGEGAFLAGVPRAHRRLLVLTRPVAGPPPGTVTVYLQVCK